ncbi:MAG: IS1595 family transposase [Cenarchaeum sp. SB0665_bin_23]|nr:IS1595 family transposase [Cenarchaeum sp. SB0665_bin_23]MYB47311.1 IS1595 family transposase [Cenarchaeum sp. SB0662_bin_33]MYG33517.1 IS1595 family transposase [Cenarchaeum sp. SB0677_bin_16]
MTREIKGIIYFITIFTLSIILRYGVQQAPGKSYREGITLTQLIQMFPNDETAEKWFESTIWKDKPCCPFCGNTNIKKTKYKKMPYYCAGRGNCHKRFSVKVGTVMEQSHISYQHWAIATYQFMTNVKGISSMKLHRDLGITQKTAWFMVQRLRESWKQLAGVDKMEGPVEIDEAYFGGKEANKHASKKRRNRQGGVGKTAVVGIKDHNTGMIRAKPVPETTTARLEFIRQNVESDSTHYTDENSAYAHLTNHYTVQHNIGE